MQSLLNEIWRTGRLGVWAFLLGACLLGLWNACFAALPVGTTRLRRIGNAVWRVFYCLLMAQFASGRANAGVLDWPVLAGLAVSGFVLTPIILWVVGVISTALGRIFGPIARAIAGVFAPVVRAVPRTSPFRFAMGMVLFACVGLVALLAAGFVDR